MPTKDSAVSNALDDIGARIDVVTSEIRKLDNTPIEETAEGLGGFERKMMDAHRRLAALKTARRLQLLIAGVNLVEVVRDLVKSLRGKYRNLGWRMVEVTMLGGIRVKIAAPYFARTAGRAIAKGIYPHFILLGLLDKTTPALASTVAKYATALASFEEARAMLGDQGISLNVKTVRSITKAFAERARIGQRLAAAAEEGGGAKDSSTAPRKMIVVSTDGGRIRVRRKKRGRKRKGKGKRTGYHADWREPKLIIIYAVDEEGRMDKKVPPVIDATLAGPDAAFDLLAFYLGRLGITDKDELAFIADGARWIWERITDLRDKLKLAKARIVELLDFYHVAQHVHAIAELKRWTTRRRNQWARKIRKWLKGGRHWDALVEIRTMTLGTKSKALRRERAYFEKNKGRLDYAAMKRKKRPIGSGAVESAIRRVICLRLKGPSIMWLESTAEEMLFLRCYYKAGRWQEIEGWASQHQALAM